MQQKNYIIDELNPQQRQAVLENSCNLLILAGAGSGKTKTLTHKIAFILNEGLAKPYQILALTFTNKAAGEMKERIGKLIGSQASDMWIGTFHSIALKILRKEGFRPTIYDSKDQENLIKEILKKLNIDSKKYTPRAFCSSISSLKLKLTKPEDLKVNSPFEKYLKSVYRLYEESLAKANAVDFDNIILRVIELLEENEDVRKKYSNKFKYIFIDEYQDTNYPQYLFVRLLYNSSNIVCAVGDEDQSIYGFRGAQIDNILKFDREYENCKIIKLEKNYRSAQEILNIANTLISKNNLRKEKRLYSDKIGGRISIVNLATETEEAKFVAEQIQKLKLEGENLYDIAVLYRTNFQSRTIEEALIRYSIPYNIIGSKRFLERKEIKDVIAYLKLLVNPNDDIAFLRAIGSHPRGIGAKFLEVISKAKDSLNTSMFEASKWLIEKKKVTPRQEKALKQFLSVFDINTAKSVDKIIDEIIQISGLKNHLEQTDDFDRIANIMELKNTGNLNNLESFLEDLSLLDYSNELEEQKESVRLMTIHASKGLEFNTVFIVGVEEGLFPNENLKRDELDIEEERRLFYVAITRAKTNLFISHASSRRRGIDYQRSKPSRFLLEIKEKIKHKPLKRGDKIRHSIYGEGVVLSKDGQLLTVNFSENGIKKILEKDRNLSVV
ncbi:ATP-dependent helicase [Hippea maritima]|uniref:DNA 3'-5' helicase n=1 Tax=Hippea maritima (strain ATCC 700847 / DSM 10411 / MH2) TaxID=760142 RepID=F2LW95_HIPMA|nr:UvrD-helicase domain-containing protein [Hippea maritima]AEA34029.1 UvrD/REP helicase [Hippea maritima DSM 10411]